MDDVSLYLDPSGARSELFVLVHGLGNQSKRLADARAVIREQYPDADILAPRMPYADNWLCTEKPEAMVARIVACIDVLWAERGGDAGYRKITLVGHSIGAVLARKIAIVAHGEQANLKGDMPAPFEPEFAPFRDGRPWAGRIGRLVLLAGINRGWSVASTVDWLTGFKMGMFEFLAELLTHGEHIGLTVRRGAPFLVQTRLQWLSMMNPDYDERANISVVQLLGTVDDLVAPDDCVDYSVDLRGNGETPSFFYLNVSKTNHSNVVEMAAAGLDSTSAIRADRRATFLGAINDSPEALAARCIPPEAMSDDLPQQPDKSVDELVFVIHGIRDKGFWTKKLAHTIKLMAPPGKKIASWTESYGYFAMLPFLLRTVRQRKVEWLMDRYVEARARYPNAIFHYIGHSNGTYLAAQALRDYPAAQFDKIVFAGSVVRTDYDWKERMALPAKSRRQRPQAGSVLNFVATGDWVVAMLTNGLRWSQRINVGGAGHNGFDQSATNHRVHQVNYIVGSHGVGHEEDNWTDIARFILEDRPPEVKEPRYSKTQSHFWRNAGKTSIVFTPTVLAVLLVFGALQFLSIFGAVPLSHFHFFGEPWQWWLTKEPDALGAAWRAMGFFAYFLVIRTIITRF